MKKVLTTSVHCAIFLLTGWAPFTSSAGTLCNAIQYRQFKHATQLWPKASPCVASPAIWVVVPHPGVMPMAQKRNYEYTNDELVAIAKLSPHFSSPSFQFYVNDFLGSSRTMVMEPTEVGAFCLLLLVEWNEKDCGLPSDDYSLAQLSRLRKDWDTYKNHLLGMFFEHEGRIYNRRLLQERRKQIEGREQRAKAGASSAKSRKSNQLDNPTTVEVSLNGEEAPVKAPSLTQLKARYAKAIFEVWQEREHTVTHQAFTPDMIKNVTLWHGQHSEGDLVQAVKNYNEVLGGSEYWWTHSFTFENFFRRGGTQKPAPFKTFLTEAKPLTNYRVKDDGAQQVQLVEEDNYDQR